MSELVAKLVHLLNVGTDHDTEVRQLLEELVRERSCMSDRAIMRALEAKRIYISPFVPENLGTCNYDITLGPHFYRENREPGVVSLYNPYDEAHVRQVWGDARSFCSAITAGEWRTRNCGFPPLTNIPDEAQIIILDPGETILAHTLEFIGGADDRITTMMKARSSMGRNFVEVCKCAGWGDIGYHNRWTMEITNNSTKYQIPLVVGRRIAQLIFLETEGASQAKYNTSGKYQSGELGKMESTWHPSMILPKMYQDREVRALGKG